MWLLRQRSQPPTCAVVHCNRYADSSHSRHSPDPYAMRSPDNSQRRQRHQPPDDHSVVDAPCPRAAIIRLLVRLVRHCAFCRVLICPNMFSCVILRAPNLPGTMTCKFTHFFPPVQQPRKCRLCRPPRKNPLRSATAPHLAPHLVVCPLPHRNARHPIPPKKNVDFFSKKIIFSIYLFPPLGIYTQTPPSKGRRQNKITTKSTSN